MPSLEKFQTKSADDDLPEAYPLSNNKSSGSGNEAFGV